jgi:hypothetical protein
MKRLNFRNLFVITVTLLFSIMPALLMGQATANGEMPQYLFGEFSKCDVLMKGGKVNTAMMNYNTVTEKMVFISNNEYYDLIDPETVDTVKLGESKFVPVGKAFYEVLLSQPVALFIQHKGTLMSAGKPAGYGGTSQTSSSNYITSIQQSGIHYNLALPSDFIVNPANVYWIRIGDKWSDFTSEKQFVSLFPGKASEIKSFIKANHIKIDKPENLKMLVEYCSTL